jgi:putative PIN family toxin of toxin-antitoxin system
VRAVLDVNVLISALLSRDGSSGRLIALWLDGAFELVVSDALLAELHRALRYRRLRRHIAEADGDAFIELLRSMALPGVDVARPDPVSRDPGDDYLVALARRSNSVLVTGDDDLLDLARELPIRSPSQFLASLQASVE